MRREGWYDVMREYQHFHQWIRQWYMLMDGLGKPVWTDGNEPVIILDILKNPPVRLINIVIKSFLTLLTAT